jgi:hypothetical protein
MKPPILFIVVILLLAVNGFSQSANRRSPTSTRQVPIEVEGQREAIRFWSNYVASCNGSHYVKKTSSVFVELRGFNIQTSYFPLTEADRLNGVQAKGVSKYTASAHRFYSNLAWHEWGNSIPDDMELVNSISFQKVRGRWQFLRDGYFNQFARTISCSDLPGMGGRKRNETPTNAVEIDDTHNFPIEGFTIWESSSNDPGNRFPQSRATFINWSITFAGTAFSYTPPTVESYWYKDGVLWSYANGAQFRNVDKGIFWTGKGWAEPGRWELGTYTIKIYVRKKLSAVGKFEIVPDDTLPKELRFNGFYKASFNGDASHPGRQIEWYRFYEDGSLFWTETPTAFTDNLDKLGVCLSTVGHNYNCDGIDVQKGTYTISGSNIHIRFNYRQDEGELGPGTINLRSNVGFAAKYTFINAAEWLCDRGRRC